MNIIDNTQNNKEIIVKIYPYLIYSSTFERDSKLINIPIRNEEPWFNTNTTSLININGGNDYYSKNDSFKGSEFLKRLNGKDYFEAVISKIGTQELMSNYNMEMTGNDWTNLDKIELIMNDFIVPRENKLVGKLPDELMFVFTINEPIKWDRSNPVIHKLNPDRHQKIYFTSIVNKTNELTDDERKFQDFISDAKQEQVVHLTSQFQIQSNFKGCQIFFYDGDYVPEITMRTDTKYDFEVITSPYTIIDGIYATGKQLLNPGDVVANYKRIEITLKNINKQLIPFKWQPIDVNNSRVSIYTPWWDYNFALPYYSASKYLQGDTTMDGLFRHGKSTQSEDFIKVIKDTILVGYLFKTQFRDIPRLKPTKDIPGAQGQIDPKETIGEAYSYNPKKMHLINIANQNPVQVSKLLYDQFLTHYGSSLDLENLKVFNSIIAAISKYVFAPNAVSQGIVPFNEIMLPWYFDVSYQITIKKTKDNWTLVDDKLYWRLFSKYFEHTTSGMKPIVPNLSEVKTITTDKVDIIAPLPEVISPLPLYTNPASMSPGNSNNNNVFTKYISYIPIGINTSGSKIDWKQYLYGLRKSAGATSKKIKFDLPKTKDKYKSHLNTLDNDIINYVKNDLGYGNNVTVDIIYRGNKEVTYDIEQISGTTYVLYTADPAAQTPKLSKDYLLNSYNSNFVQWGATPIPSIQFPKAKVYFPIFNDKHPYPVPDNSNTKIGTIRKMKYIDISGFNPIARPPHAYELDYDFDLELFRDAYKDVEVIVNGIPRDTTVDYDRQTVYTKQAFINKLVEQTDLDIKINPIIQLQFQEKSVYMHTFIISSLWNDKINLHINDVTRVCEFEIPALNSYNETLTKQTITFH